MSAGNCIYGLLSSFPFNDILTYFLILTSSMMASYKMTYVDRRSRGEVIRLLFHAAGVEFEDIRLSVPDEYYKLPSGKSFCFFFFFFFFFLQSSLSISWLVLGLLNIVFIRSIRTVATEKQCRPRSDATECGVGPGSTLFATHSIVFIHSIR